jgi:hypothetical protein
LWGWGKGGWGQRPNSQAPSTTRELQAVICIESGKSRGISLAAAIPPVRAPTVQGPIALLFIHSFIHSFIHRRRRLIDDRQGRRSGDDDQSIIVVHDPSYHHHHRGAHVVNDLHHHATVGRSLLNGTWWLGVGEAAVALPNLVQASGRQNMSIRRAPHC